MSENFKEYFYLTFENGTKQNCFVCGKPSKFVGGTKKYNKYCSEECRKRFGKIYITKNNTEIFINNENAQLFVEFCEENNLEVCNFKELDSRFTPNFKIIKDNKTYFVDIRTNDSPCSERTKKFLEEKEKFLNEYTKEKDIIYKVFTNKFEF